MDRLDSTSLTTSRSPQVNNYDMVEKLSELLAGILPKLRDIPESDFSFKPTNKWSKKEILGHLCDSAANNHQRFIRTQYEEKPSVKYNQDKWVELNDWQNWPTNMIIDFWNLYNRRLVEVIKKIPKEKLSAECAVGDKTFTLEFLIEDYVVHLKHHLDQILDIED